MIRSFTNPEIPLTLGILGAGQLAKMLASAAYRMGINVAVIDKGENNPAGDMTKNDYTKGWFDNLDLQKFIDSCDIVTLENEFISPDILAGISKQVYPSPDTMRLVQDKLIQKKTFQNASIPVPEFREMNSVDDLIHFGSEFGYPFIVKTRTLGYDGYGNFTVEGIDQCQKAWDKFNTGLTTRPLMAESFVNFSKELAVMVARRKNGEYECYPCVETIQSNHICNVVIAPAEIATEYREAAKSYALKCVEAIDGVGVFGVEMFLTDDNKILVNEIAPRPHNSGHYTIEACYTSQYENCIRAVLDLPLGSAEMIAPAACMYNLLGVRDGYGTPSDVTEVLKLKKVWLHLYNKKQSRIGRKMGHLTTLGQSQKEAYELAKRASESIIW